VHTQPLEPLRNGRVLRDEHAAIAVAAEILRGEEAERPDGGNFARHARLAVHGAPRTDGLRGILDDGQARHRERHVLDRRHLAEQVHRNHRLRPRRPGRSDRRGQDVERPRLDVHEHWRRADVVNGAGRGEEGERRGDDLVARLQGTDHALEANGLRAANPVVTHVLARHAQVDAVDGGNAIAFLDARPGRGS